MQNHGVILQQIKEAEQKFKANDYKGISDCSCVVEKHGNLPILLSAPHSVKQICKGKIKVHEFYTGAIVECLAKELGCSHICRQHLNENAVSDDPNSDGPSCPYKTAVSQFVRTNDISLFVDIHGLSEKRESIMDVCIDGGNNVNNMEYVYDLQKRTECKFGKDRCSIDKYFSASPSSVMSKWVHTNFGISAIELEINRVCRWFEGDFEKQSVEMYILLRDWLKNISF